MKFSLFLLLLTTLISIALSQNLLIPSRNRIRLINTNLYWALNGTDLILIAPTPQVPAQQWTIEPYNKGSYFLPVGYIGTVQYNGVSKQLTVTTREENLNHRWLLTVDNPVAISSSQDFNIFITAEDSNVVTGYDFQPRWILE